MSADGYVTTPDGRPAQLADPTFVPGKSHGFPEFQKTCEAVLMGRTTSEPALAADRWPYTRSEQQWASKSRTWITASSPLRTPTRAT